MPLGKTSTHGHMAIAAMIAFVAMSLNARANDGFACVVCEGPMATYSCSVAPDANGVRSRGSHRALHFACIKDIAQRFGHTTCGAKKHPAGDCAGIVHMLDPSVPRKPTVGAESEARAKPLPGTQPERSRPERENALRDDNKAAQKREDKAEPKTVVELAEDTARSTEKQLRQSTKQVSDAAKSTWQCITSLFSDC